MHSKLMIKDLCTTMISFFSISLSSINQLLGILLTFVMLVWWGWKLIDKINGRVTKNEVKDDITK